MNTPHGPAHRIRPASEPDSDDIARIWHDGWREAHLGRVPAQLVAARTPESFAVRAVENLERTSVADVDGHVAGFVTVADDELEQLYLDDQHRGRGVAHDLLREGERRIAALGHDHAWLAVVAGNTHARSFYGRCGWTDAGPFDHVAPGGIIVPAHRYVRALHS
jgi:GNAT superfamily N-acetyltransferase